MEFPKTFFGENKFIFHNIYNKNIFCFAYVKVYETYYENKEWYIYSIDF